ncbi:MAG TPA: nitroreductase family protein [Candidatus Nanopelagicales bacterium]
MSSTVVAPRTASTEVDLHPLLADRWSPRAFDRTPLEDSDVTALLEAARWAPSANNYQPWRFLVGRQGTEGADSTYKGIYDALAEFNQLWASAAPVLVAAVVEVEHEDGSAREIAPYELGLAVSQLTVEAAARGLHVHQMGGFDAAQISAEFGIPPQYRTVVVLAVGRLGDPEALPAWAAERETAPRERKPLADIAFAGRWGTPHAA